MQRAQHPSHQAIDRAHELGRLAATTERNLVPQVHFIREFRSFAHYREAHRYCLEQSRAFAVWDERLRGIIDQEGIACGYNLNDSLQWDDFYQYISTPMRASFWFGWESMWQLPRIHEVWWQEHPGRPEVQRKRTAKEGVPAAHPFIPPVNVPVPGEKESWEAITSKLFEQQLGKDDDEAFWSLPEASQIAQKPAEPT